jgi:hypothetical protein
MDKPTARIDFRPTRAVLLNYDETQLTLRHLRIRKDQIIDNMIVSAKEGLTNDIIELSKHISELDRLIARLEG